MLKTHQGISKRVKITKTGKVIKIKAGQNHFNARESGNITRQKRRDVTLGKQHAKNIKSLLPHN